MNIQDTAIYTLGGAAATVLGVLTFLSSPFFGPFFGGVVAATATYVYQARAWKRTVKRENSLKHNELIYSPLYKEVGRILDQCNGFNFMSGYTQLNYPEWSRVRSEPYYRFVDQPLSSELEAFYKLVETFNTNQQKLASRVPTFILGEFAKKFKVNGYDVSYASRDSSDHEMSTTYFNNTILFGVHPIEVLKQHFPNRDDLKYYPQFKYILPGGTGATIVFREPKEIEGFDAFYFDLSKRVMNSDDAKDLKTALGEIIRKAPGLKESLFQVYKKTSA